MGMKKIAKADQDKIILVLQKWPNNLKLTWEGIRGKLATTANVGPEEVWSRQSLSGNYEIHAAFTSAKRRTSEGAVDRNLSEVFCEQDRILKLESALNELQARYDVLLLRHAQLAYNASLLEGGSHLLDDPLPDNTRSQSGR